MSSAVRLNDDDRQRFSDAVEASFDISSRQQFFVWTQGSVQGLVPHQILVCGLRDGSGRSMTLQRFSASRYFRQEHFDAVSDPVGGLLPRLMAVSTETGESIVFSPRGRARLSNQQLDELVAAHELRNLAAGLVNGIDGHVEAFYGFARVEAPFDARLERLIELMVPHVHRTFLRVLASEREVVHTSTPKGAQVVTPRQAEILTLIREGKTNAEIAKVLECSQWTVKNHIQNILRRLDSHSRAHALARAMQLGILRPE